MKNTRVLGLLILLAMAPSVKAESTMGQKVGGFGIGAGAGLLHGTGTLLALYAGNITKDWFADNVIKDYGIKWAPATLVALTIFAINTFGLEKGREWLVEKCGADSDVAFWTSYVSSLATTATAYFKPEWTLIAAAGNLKARVWDSSKADDQKPLNVVVRKVNLSEDADADATDADADANATDADASK